MKSIVITIVLVSLLGLMAYTNPNLDAYQNFIQQKIIQETRKTGDKSEQALALFFGGIASSLVASQTVRNDYVFFSIYDTKFDKEYFKSIGIFKNFILLKTPESFKYPNTVKARQQIAKFSNALDMYRLEVGRYPTTNEGLQALIKPPPGASRWNGPYLTKDVILEDPWGNDYHYRSPSRSGRAFEVYSLGADNAEGGTGESQDIFN